MREPASGEVLSSHATSSERSEAGFCAGSTLDPKSTWVGKERTQESGNLLEIHRLGPCSQASCPTADAQSRTSVWAEQAVGGHGIPDPQKQCRKDSQCLLCIPQGPPSASGVEWRKAWSELPGSYNLAETKVGEAEVGPSIEKSSLHHRHDAKVCREDGEEVEFEDDHRGGLGITWPHSRSPSTGKRSNPQPEFPRTMMNSKQNITPMSPSVI